VKYVSFLLVAAEAVDPQVALVPGFRVPPSVRVLAVIFAPAAILAVAEPVGAMDKLLLITVPLGMVFAPEPDRVR